MGHGFFSWVTDDLEGVQDASFREENPPRIYTDQTQGFTTEAPRNADLLPQILAENADKRLKAKPSQTFFYGLTSGRRPRLLGFDVICCA
jgi:hypothetical protein